MGKIRADSLVKIIDLTEEKNKFILEKGQDATPSANTIE